jgi:hypothetical protein
MHLSPPLLYASLLLDWRRRVERCREKGRVRGEMYREGDGDCSSV